MEIHGEYSVRYGGSPVGHLSVSQKGLMTEFKCECVLATGEILRLAVLSRNRYEILGVMLPDGDRLRYKKSYSKNDLAKMSLDSIDGCKLVRPGDSLLPDHPAPPEEPYVNEPDAPEEPEIPPELPQPHAPPDPEYIAESHDAREMIWQYEEKPWELFSDAELQRACQNVTGALSMTIEGVTLLAIPFKAGAPFPAMPIFCFGESYNIQEKDYLIFKIKNGNLVG